VNAGPISTGKLPVVDVPPAAKPAPTLTPEAEVQLLRTELANCHATLEEWIRAETSWTQQRRLFKIMTENSADLIALADAGGNRTWNNAPFSRALGHEAAELAGTHVFSEVHADDRTRVLEVFADAQSRRVPAETEHRALRKDGGTLYLKTTVVPVVSAEQKLESFVLISQDVTENRRLEEALALASSQSTAKGMVEAMARDFDQILTNAFGNLAIARTLNGTKNAVAVRLNEIERALQRSRDLLEQMFSVSPEGGQPPVRTELEPLVREAANGVLRGTLLRAEYLFPQNLPEVKLDREAFLHALRSLLTNSVQASEKGVIRITADYLSQEQLAQRTEIALKPGNYICLRIQDQGQGMTEKTLLHAFEPYFTTRSGAQGLGLTTALSTLQRMGGTILLDSTPAVGTTAQVYLPAPVLKARTTATGARLPSMTTETLIKPAPKRRILLMDDEQMILDIVSRMLTHLGYEVATCNNGAQAIAAFTKAKTNNAPFDVAVMDLVIPNGVGGQDAVHTIRKIDPQAKVIASSGHLEHPAMVDFKKFGFVAVLEKPYKLERLQQVIDAVIETAA
jgi:PAS domain S-box-containing protein